jgi:hypothetical protein
MSNAARTASVGVLNAAMTASPMEVPLICGNPVGRKSFLCFGYIDFPITDQITHQALEPIFSLRIPRRFYAPSRLRPEIGWFVRAAKSEWNKVIDLVVRVRSRPQSVSSKNFVPSRGKHRTPVFFAVSTRGIALTRPYGTAGQILVWSNLKGRNGRDSKNGGQRCDGHRLSCRQRALHWRRLRGAVGSAAWRSLPRPPRLVLKVSRLVFARGCGAHCLADVMGQLLVFRYLARPAAEPFLLAFLPPNMRNCSRRDARAIAHFLCDLSK